MATKAEAGSLSTHYCYSTTAKFQYNQQSKIVQDFTGFDDKEHTQFLGTIPIKITMTALE